MGVGCSGYPISSVSLKNFSNKAPQSATCTGDVDLPPDDHTLLNSQSLIPHRPLTIQRVMSPLSVNSPRARCLHYLSAVSGRPMTTRRGAVSLLLAQILRALRTEQLIAVTSLLALVTARLIVNPTHNHSVFTLIAGYNGPSIQYNL